MALFCPSDIDLVRNSFLAASSNTEALATAFFRHLFEIDRSLRALFHGDMRQLGCKFVSTLGALVNNLDRFDEFAPHMRSLGARHAGYHVREGHYATAGIALIDTLAHQLGDAFTPEMRAAWTRVYQSIAGEIIAGARSAAVGDPASRTSPAVA